MPQYNYEFMNDPTFERYMKEQQKRMMYPVSSPRPAPKRSHTVCPPSHIERIESSCNICGDNFHTMFDKMSNKQEEYLCTPCIETYGRDGISEGFTAATEVEELLKEAEDHFNGVERPKKEKPSEELLNQEDYTMDPVEFPNPYDEMLQSMSQRMVNGGSNQEDNSSSWNKDQNKRDWWKIYGIITTVIILSIAGGYLLSFL